MLTSQRVIAGAYAYLKVSAKQLKRHREALRAAEAAAPGTENVHDALKPVETALEKAVRDIIVGVELSRTARDEAEARPYA